MSTVEAVRSYSTAEAARAAGVSYRRADYWARLGLVRPSLVEARGSGTYRRYSADDAVRLAVMGALTDAGLGLDVAARAAAETLEKGARRGSATGRVRVLRGDHVDVLVDVFAIADAVRARL